MPLQTQFHLAALMAVITSCTLGMNAKKTEQNAARAEEARVVFSALLCAYDEARAGANPAQAAQIDDEVTGVRAVFRESKTDPRPCSDPLISRLAACVDVFFEEGEILNAWRSDNECSSEEIAPYVK